LSFFDIFLVLFLCYYQLLGTLPHTATIGDVDGDGQLDVVVVAVSDTGSHIWAVRGDTGETLAGFPIALPAHSVATSSVLLADLHNYNTPTDTTDTNIGQDQFERKNDPNAPIWTINSEGHKLKITEKESGFDLDTKREKSSTSGHQKLMKNKGLHLILATFDGHVYIIDGVTKCSERIDVGEHIYSTPLLDDVTGACVYIYIYMRGRERYVCLCVYTYVYI
jgi:hypothetical protein